MSSHQCKQLQFIITRGLFYLVFLIFSSLTNKKKSFLKSLVLIILKTFTFWSLSYILPISCLYCYPLPAGRSSSTWLGFNLQARPPFRGDNFFPVWNLTLVTNSSLQFESHHPTAAPNPLSRPSQLPTLYCWNKWLPALAHICHEA